MKTKLLIIVTILLLASSVSLKAQTTQYEWEYVTSLNTTELLRKVYTQGLDTVFVVGYDGLIARSANRTLTWTKLYSANSQLNDIFFSNHQTGFAVGNNGVILKTINSGNTWTPISSGTKKNINAVAGIGLNNIWAVGDSGLVVQSVDTGKTWTVKNLLSNNKQLNDIKFNGLAGYIAGNGGTVLNTSNGGSSWTNFNVNWVSSLYTYGVHSLSITNNKVHAILYESDPAYGTAISSESTIDNWSRYKDIYARNISAGSMCFINDNLGYYAAYAWTTGSSGFGLWIYKTTDGGQNWQQTTINNYYGSINQFSNFSFNSDHSYGYFICGNVMLRTPYTGDFTVGLNDIKSDYQTIQIKQQGNKLQVSSLSKAISAIEIISLGGTTICQQKNKLVNIQQIPSGVYLIRATYTDSSKSNFVKWIKR